MHSRRKSKTGGRHKKNKTRSKTRKIRRSRRSSKRSGHKRSSRRSSSRRSSSRRMRGGNAMWPLIGAPYNAAAAYPAGNYLEYNPKVEAWPEQSGAILDDRGMIGLVRAGGGRTRKGTGTGARRGKGKKQRGGGLNNFISAILPEEAVNIGRSVPAAFSRAYDNFSGSLSPPSSFVYPTQQPTVNDVTLPKISPPDILNMYNTANTQVARM